MRAYILYYKLICSLFCKLLFFIVVSTKYRHGLISNKLNLPVELDQSLKDNTLIRFPLLDDPVSAASVLVEVFVCYVENIRLDV